MKVFRYLLCIVFVDSLFDRSTSKKTEMLAKVFHHCSMKYKKEFRLLTLGWSDGNSFVPINHCLLSVAKDENLLCTSKQYDGRSLAARRRKQSRRKATDVMVGKEKDKIPAKLV